MNSLKTIYSRITTLESAKNIIEDAGVAMYEMGDAGEEIRPVGDILKDLGGKWYSLSKEQQQNIAVTVAGRYQLSRFLAYMNNHEMALKATATAYNSQGSAIRENEKYLTSFEARINALKNGFTELSLAIGDAFLSDGLLTLIELLRRLAEGAVWFVDKFGALPVVFLTLSAVLGKMGYLSTMYGALYKGVDALSKVGKEAKETQKAAEQTGNNMHVMGEKTEKATGKAAKGMRGLSRSIKGVLAATGVGLAFVALGTAIEFVTGKLADSKRQSEEVEKQQKAMVDAYHNHGNSFDDLIKKYDDLNKKFEQNKEAMSDDELLEYTNVTNELANALPTVVDYVDASGQAHLKNTDAIKEEAKRVAELATEQAKLKELKMPETIEKQAQSYKKATEELKALKAERQRLIDEEKNGKTEYSAMGVAYKIPPEAVDNREKIKKLDIEILKKQSEVTEAVQKNIKTIQDQTKAHLEAKGMLKDLGDAQITVVENFATQNHHLLEASNKIKDADKRAKEMNNTMNLMTGQGNSLGELFSQTFRDLSEGLEDKPEKLQNIQDGLNAVSSALPEDFLVIDTKAGEQFDDVYNNVSQVLGVVEELANADENVNLDSIIDTLVNTGMEADTAKGFVAKLSTEFDNQKLRAAVAEEGLDQYKDALEETKELAIEAIDPIKELFGVDSTQISGLQTHVQTMKILKDTYKDNYLEMDNFKLAASEMAMALGITEQEVIDNIGYFDNLFDALGKVSVKYDENKGSVLDYSNLTKKQTDLIKEAIDKMGGEATIVDLVTGKIDASAIAKQKEAEAAKANTEETDKNTESKNKNAEAIKKVNDSTDILKQKYDIFVADTSNEASRAVYFDTVKGQLDAINGQFDVTKTKDGDLKFAMKDGSKSVFLDTLNKQLQDTNEYLDITGQDTGDLKLVVNQGAETKTFLDIEDGAKKAEDKVKGAKKAAEDFDKFQFTPKPLNMDFGALANSLKTPTEKAEALAKALKTTSENIGAISTNADGVLKKVGNFTSTLDTILNNTASFKPINDAVDGLNRKLVTAQENLGKLFTGSGIKIGEIKQPVGEAMTAVDNLTKSFQNLNENIKLNGIGMQISGLATMVETTAGKIAPLKGILEGIAGVNPKNLDNYIRSVGLLCNSLALATTYSQRTATAQSQIVTSFMKVQSVTSTYTKQLEKLSDDGANAFKRMADAINKATQTLVTAFNKNRTELGKLSSYTETKTKEISRHFNKMEDSVLKSMQSMTKKMRELFENTVEKMVAMARSMPKRMGDGISSMAKGVDKGVKALANQIGNGMENAINKTVIKGVNDALTFMGVDKKLSKVNIPAYATGTDHHQGGLALVGEEGRELAHIPNFGVTMLGENGAEIRNLPKGTSVLPHDKTELLAQRWGLPAYATGIGDYFAKFFDQKDKLLPNIMKDFGVGDPFADVPNGGFKDLAKGGVEKVEKAGADYLDREIKEYIKNFLAVGGYQGGFEKSPDKVGAGAGYGGMMKYVEYWYNQVKDRFGKTRFMGAYANRGVVGNAKVKSMHAYGRAFDIGGSHETMSQIAEFLRLAPNIQYVIYNRKISGAGTGKPWRKYTGLNPHTDHVHADFKGFATGGANAAHGFMGGANGKFNPWAIDLSGVSNFGGSIGDGTFSSPDIGFSQTGGGGGYGWGKAKAVDWATKALQILGKPMNLVDELVRIAYQESSYNRNWINNWDSNARKGQASRGIMHTIPATFNSYKLKGYNNILNPVHNMIAAVRYLEGRYGGVHNHPGLKSIARGGGYKPYANGGFIDRPHMGLVGEAGREVIIPLTEKRRRRGLDLWTKAGQELGVSGNTIDEMKRLSGLRGKSSGGVAFSGGGSFGASSGEGGGESSGGGDSGTSGIIRPSTPTLVPSGIVGMYGMDGNYMFSALASAPSTFVGSITNNKDGSSTITRADGAKITTLRTKTEIITTIETTNGKITKEVTKLTPEVEKAIKEEVKKQSTKMAKEVAENTKTTTTTKPKSTSTSTSKSTTSKSTSSTDVPEIAELFRVDKLERSKTSISNHISLLDARMQRISNGTLKYRDALKEVIAYENTYQKLIREDLAKTEKRQAEIQKKLAAWKDTSKHNAKIREDYNRLQQEYESNMQKIGSLKTEIENSVTEIRQKSAEMFTDFISEIAKKYDDAIKVINDKIDNIDFRIEVASLVEPDNLGKQLELMQQKAYEYQAKQATAYNQRETLKHKWLYADDKWGTDSEQAKEALAAYEAAMEGYEDSALDVLRIEKEMRDVRTKVIDDAIAGLKEYYSKMKDMAQDAIDAEIKSLQKAHEAKMKLYDDEIKKINDIYDAKMKEIDEANSEEEYNQAVSENTKKQSDLMNKIALLSRNKDLESRKKVAELQAELTEAQADLEELQQNRADDLRKKALEEQKAQQIEAIEQRKEADEKAHEEQIDNLEEEKQAIAKKYDDIINNERYWAQVRNEAMKGNFDLLQTELTGMESTLQNMNKGIFDGLTAGFSGFSDEVKRQIIELNKLLVDNLMFGSEGFLKDMNDLINSKPYKDTNGKVDLDKATPVPDVKLETPKPPAPPKTTTPAPSTQKPADKKTETGTKAPATTADKFGTIKSTLKKGSKGEEVKILQRFLGVKADGIFGNETHTALVNWQKRNGLTADGIAGKNTLTKMGLLHGAKSVPLPNQPSGTKAPTIVADKQVINNANLLATASSQGKVVTALKKGQGVKYLGADGNWLRVQTLDGKIGWIGRQHIGAVGQTSTPAQFDFGNKKVVNNANLLAGASSQSKVIEALSKGDRVEYIGADGNWLKVKTKSGKIGWIGRQHIASLDTGGYTGEWGRDGKLGILHEKELVLKKDDTANLLDAVKVLGKVKNIIPEINQTNLANKLAGALNIENKTENNYNVDIRIDKVIGDEKGAEDVASKIMSELKKKGLGR